MKRIILLLLLTLPLSIFAQKSSDRIAEELKSWDPVRGEWLASSVEAMANDEPIPHRTFPENYTPQEMFTHVPQEQINRINNLMASNEDSPRNAEVEQEENPRSPAHVYRRMVNSRNCSQKMGRSYGDPHLSSFDGKKFSFQTVGEFVLAKSATSGFEVQSRQKPQNDRISLNTAVAMNVNGDRVGIYASDYPDNNAATPVRVNGRPVYIESSVYFLPKGGTIEKSGRKYLVTWSTGEKVQAKLSRTSGMSFMNIAVNVFPCSDSYRGVLGNANGHPNDDFGSRGSSIASSSVFDPFGDRDFGRSSNAEKEHLAFLAKDFANQHRVTDNTSLFDYAFGESTWTFTDESFPRVHLTLADLSADQRSRARRQCETRGINRADMSGCVYDVAYANIPPEPRPTITDRTRDRDLKPVRKPILNVNEEDSDGGRDPGNGSGGAIERKPENKTPSIGNETAPQPLPENENDTKKRKLFDSGKETNPERISQPNPKPVVEPSKPEIFSSPKPEKPERTIFRPKPPKPSKGVQINKPKPRPKPKISTPKPKPRTIGGGGRR